MGHLDRLTRGLCTRQTAWYRQLLNPPPRANIHQRFSLASIFAAAAFFGLPSWTQAIGSHKQVLRQPDILKQHLLSSTAVNRHHGAALLLVIKLLWPSPCAVSSCVLKSVCGSPQTKGEGKKVVVAVLPEGGAVAKNKEVRSRTYTCHRDC